MKLGSGARVHVRTAVITAAVTAGLVSAGFAIAASPAPTITACVSNLTQSVRMPADGNCRSTERAVTWNSEGPAGAPGATGPQGPAGPPGSGSGGSYMTLSFGYVKQDNCGVRADDELVSPNPCPFQVFKAPPGVGVVRTQVLLAEDGLSEDPDVVGYCITGLPSVPTYRTYSISVQAENSTAAGEGFVQFEDNDVQFTTEQPDIGLCPAGTKIVLRVAGSDGLGGAAPWNGNGDNNYRRYSVFLDF